MVDAGDPEATIIFKSGDRERNCEMVVERIASSPVFPNP
jgi:hypothetical protein